MFRSHTCKAGLLGAAALVLSLAQFAAAQPAGTGAIVPTAKLTVGSWQYDFALKAWGTRSEGLWGTLTYAGKQLSEESLPGLAMNDYVHTPWGTFYWQGMSKLIWGAHGWFPTPSGNKSGKRLTPPGAPANECVLMEVDNGSTARVAQGTRVLVQLPVSQPFERRWNLVEQTGESLRAQGMPIGHRSPLPPSWGAAALMQHAFVAEQPGKTTLTFAEQGTTDRKIRLTVEVGAPAAPMPSNSAEAVLSSNAPQAGVTLRPGGTLKVAVSLAGGTGYKLQLVPPLAAAATLVSGPIIEPPTSNLLGAPSLYRYELRLSAAPPPEVRVVFQLRRPGQDTGPEYVVVVTVPEASK